MKKKKERCNSSLVLDTEKGILYFQCPLEKGHAGQCGIRLKSANNGAVDISWEKDENLKCPKCGSTNIGGETVEDVYCNDCEYGKCCLKIAEARLNKEETAYEFYCKECGKELKKNFLPPHPDAWIALDSCQRIIAYDFSKEKARDQAIIRGCPFPYVVQVRNICKCG